MAMINKAPITLIDTATTAAINACQRQRNNEDTQRDQRRKQQRLGHAKDRGMRCRVAKNVISRQTTKQPKALQASAVPTATKIARSMKSSRRPVN
jgi:hypothetical protein